jgi:hypothetical protein
MLRRTNAAARLAALFACGLVSTLTLPGCYTTETTLLSTTMGTFSYESTVMRPVTIKVIDIRTEEPVFTMEVPVGQQISFHFEETGGDDAVLRPAKMSWAMWDKGTIFGSLSNSLSVPARDARRIEYTLRSAPEYAPQSPEALMRADEASTKPAWETEAGGPAPRSNSSNLYR